MAYKLTTATDSEWAVLGSVISEFQKIVWETRNKGDVVRVVNKRVYIMCVMMVVLLRRYGYY